MNCKECGLGATNEMRILGISRLLTGGNKVRLLEWVRLAFAAESSVRNSRGFDLGNGDQAGEKAREYSRGEILERGEEG
ncbi:MAG: hypothetical protein FWD94_01370 [Treponema sp.]|nr:hypothetical protein [Treponema sp.]